MPASVPEQSIGTLDLDEFTPRSAFHPDLEKMKTTLRSIFQIDSIQVKEFAAGCFNKLYEVQIDDRPPLLLRIALPVDPERKTLSEVATIKWASMLTEIPIPRVIHFDASRTSDIGHEWILMSKLDGIRLEDAWNYLSLPQKTDTVRQVASFISSLLRVQLSGIGNIYPPVSSCTTPIPGPLVNVRFFYGPTKADIPRGPFRKSGDWIAARLAAIERDSNLTLEKYTVSDLLDKEVQDAFRTLKTVKKLRPLVDRIFPGDGYDEETTVLYHDDLHENNILVDGTGKVTGIVDWECVSVVPLWKAFSIPQFLDKRPRYEKPDEKNGADDVYYTELREYETTCLRKVFLEEMQRLEPKWMDVYNATQLQRDFDEAVNGCDDPKYGNHIITWADAVDAGGEVPKMWDLVWSDRS
ncbi:hypothetical protein F53441_10505 [Fusarium austroafricanum]|uniref:Aminoglycoside phosphotransferase domain-containing protein n=1 Tax=Fusarium austroafricanum TaxID=2364996 RepID=A0A8H4NVA8_9HYPO|nr:hypothetical protein F53441_10505 [Fusarium austroafricanum]